MKQCHDRSPLWLFAKASSTERVESEQYMMARFNIRHLCAAVSIAYAAGAVGGVVNYLLPMLLGAIHLTTLLGVDIAPGWSAPALYHTLVWGGLWGTILLLRFPRPVHSWYLRAFLYGLFPSLVQLLIVFPYNTPFGFGGLALGTLTPAFVLIFNTLGWSLPAYAWLTLIAAREDDFGGYDDGTMNNPLLRV